MKTKSIRLLALFMAFMMSHIVSWAGNSDFFSRVEVKANPTGAGKVYAAYGNNDYQLNQAESGADNQRNAPTHTYKIKAEANNGYEFETWDDGNTNAERTDISITAAKDVKDATGTFTATFQTIPYTITLNPGEGTVEWTEKEYNVETETFDLPEPSHSDASYHFAGWYENPQLEGAAVIRIPKGTFGNKTFYAKFDQTLTPQITGENVTLEVGQTKDAGFGFVNVSNPIPAAVSDGSNFYYTIEHNVDKKLSDETHETEVIGYDAEHNTLIAYNMGTATITFTQNATSLYEAASKSFQISVTKVSEGMTYVLYNESGSNYNIDAGGTWNEVYELKGPADELKYTAEFSGGIANLNSSITPQYSLVKSEDDKDWKDLEKITAKGDKGPYKLNGAKYLRFKTTGSLAINYKNIFVTRLNRIKAEAEPIVKTKEEEEGTTELMVDWSISNGGNLKLLCDNPHFTLSQAEIEANIDPIHGAGAITPIIVTYRNDEAEFGMEVAHITIYNDVHETTVTIQAETMKELGTVTATDDGWFTFGATENFQVPEGVEAYTGKLNGNKIELTEVACGSIIEGGQGIVFKGTEGEEYTFMQRFVEPTVEQENQFEGSSEAHTPNLASFDYYVLGYSQAAGQPKGFYHFLVEGMQIPAHKAYIKIGKQASAPARLLLGDETTGVLALPEAADHEQQPVFNLSGQRLQRLQRGVNIIGGKKVLVK